MGLKTIAGSGGGGSSGNASTYLEELSLGIAAPSALIYNFPFPYNSGTAYQITSQSTSGSGTYTISYNGTTIATISITSTETVNVFSSSQAFVAGDLFTATPSGGGSAVNVMMSIGVAYTTTGSLAGILNPITTKEIFLETGENNTFPIDSSAGFAYTINSLNGLKTTSGTITLAVNINNVAVTGLSAIAVTSTPQNINATALNAVAVGNRVTYVTTSNSTAVSLEATIIATRTS